MTFRSISLLVPGRHRRLNSSFQVKNFQMTFIRKSNNNDPLWEKDDVVWSITQYLHYVNITLIKPGSLRTRWILKIRTSKVSVSAVSSLF